MGYYRTYRNRFFLVCIVCCLIMSAVVPASLRADDGITALLESIPDPTPIPVIQGRGHITPFLRTEVYGVYGIVTAMRPGHGYFIQNPVPDDDPGTSEGLYIRSRKAAGIEPGDLIAVDGKIKEYYPGGQSSGGLSVTQLSSLR